MIVIVYFDILWYDSRTLHDPNSLVIISIPDISSNQRIQRKVGFDLLVTDLHLSPFTPNLSKLIHRLEVDFGSLLQDFSSAVDVFFCLARSTAFLVEFGKIDIYPMEIRSCLARMDSGNSLIVGLGHLN